MKRILFALALAVAALSAGPASAHMFWINLSESFNHPPGHVTSVLGFGHSLPLDDFLAGEHGVIKLDRYELVAPDKSRFALGLPDIQVSPAQQTPTKMAVTTGDLGLRKIARTRDSAPGTYQVVAQSRPMYFTSYLDAKGKQRMAPLSLDQIKDIKTPLVSMKYMSYAKSFFALDQWTAPEPVGHDLELMPLTDLSDLHAGDLVRFKVTFKGKPVSADAKAMHSMTCTSNTFGGPDKFHLDSYLMNGEAQFRMPSAGQWVANVYYKQEVAGSPQLENEKGKCTVIYTAGTIGFTVKP
ncbi:DUF4198 domain-containing protein [Salidesulfovibrio onnuriiensis]|uniref:DUF4198 domain-containing protein n=1 Tax=Salidesulfovibrio onnuriiensis TaxID=2583823 RepID=UPI0011CB9C5F|nr:DUF4198 domain-containing protein [Salidesulfovibrio onnuriiensis]